VVAQSSQNSTAQKAPLLLACLLLLSFLVYMNSIPNGFVYDDHSQIERNPYVHSFHFVGKIFGSSLLAQQGKQAAPNFYRPMQNFEFLLCYKLFGLFPYGFHLINVLLNCVVVWLVYAVSAELFSSEPFALIAAAFFALHPIHTEVVAWVDAVADLEVSIFYLLAFWLFLQLGRENARRGAGIYFAMCLSFLFALWSKEPAMTLPVLVTIFEHFYRSDRARTTWGQKLTRYAGFWVTAVFYLMLRTLSVGRLSPAALHSDISWRETIFTSLALIGHYAAMLFWPAPLVAFYSFHKSVSFSEPQVWLGLGVLLVAGVAFALLWRRARLYSFALLWIFLILAPVLNAKWMAATVFAERYLYLPSVGFAWLVACAILWLWHATELHMRTLRWVLAAAALVVALLAGREIVARNRDWKDDHALVVSTLKVRPDSPNMLSDLGQMEWSQGKHEDAIRHWHEALSDKPDTVEVLANLGFAMLEEKNYAEAIPYLQRAIQLKPQFATPHIHLARVYAAQGKPSDAEAEFRRALDIFPMNPIARKALGQYYLDESRLQDAEQQFRVANGLMPDLETWTGLGQVYNRENVSDKAEDAWRHVLVIEPFDAQAHVSLGKIYFSRGQLAEAQKEFESCLLMNPANAEALAGMQSIRAARNLSSAPADNKK
jgi:protein O-mannosyl-transferase